MENRTIVFDEHLVLRNLSHYLPKQASLKDFVHHNTLHAFQHKRFHDALNRASKIFGYKTYLSLEEFRRFYATGKIRKNVFESIVLNFCLKNGKEYSPDEWKNKLLNVDYPQDITSCTGLLRARWKSDFHVNLNKSVHPVLFRLLSAFLDQGIAFQEFPFADKSFLDAVKELERSSLVSIFKSRYARNLLFDDHIKLEDLLRIVVGSPDLYEQYLFDQQFSHPGWSGFVSVVEQYPETLLSQRKISLRELIHLELILETDILSAKLGKNFRPLSATGLKDLTPLSEEAGSEESMIVLRLWQEAFEWSYYDDVLAGIKKSKHTEKREKKTFQGLFCIDDRSYSVRRNIESVDPRCETFGTPGFFGVEFYYQPEGGKFYSKACPAPITPKFLVREYGRKNGYRKDFHFAKNSHSLVRGWMLSNSLGFLSVFRLIGGIFNPGVTSATVFSFSYMDKRSQLLIDHKGETENGLKVGFDIEEMALRVGNVLKSIGLTEHFADIVYIVGHGGSSVNNTYYAGYDCGACCGRPGGVNARVFAYMANKSEVRGVLSRMGVNIPDTTVFIGTIHDTTRDEIEYYDDENLPTDLLDQHLVYKDVFRKALTRNAKERSLRFDTIDRNLSSEQAHRKVKSRSVSLFEPRPEWNHTANALCIIGRKSLFENLYLDKRPFLNSYDYRQDPDGKYLLSVLNAAVPVCGGINLEYYFSRVDQQKLGSGTKLPHNVVGLYAVTNGVEDDLRPGLPSQMIEIHDPVRMLFIVEHYPEKVLEVIQTNPVIYEWIKNEWILFTVKDPRSDTICHFSEGRFELYEPIGETTLEDLSSSYKKQLQWEI